jgi:ketosteroid isomerase-like protein
MAPRATDESEIRQRIDTLVEAIRAKDLDRVMPAYALDVVSFDVEPPLQHVGGRGQEKERDAQIVDRTKLL